MNPEDLEAALAHADAAGDTKTAQALAAQLANMPQYQRLMPGDADLRGTQDPSQQQPMPAAPAAAAAAPAKPKGMDLSDPDAGAHAPGATKAPVKGGMDLSDPGDVAAPAGGSPAGGNPDGTTGDNWVDDANAVLQPLARTATLGASPKIEAYIASKIYGVDYDTALQAVNTRDESLKQQHNYLNAAGNVAGIGVGAVAAGPALAAAGLAPVAGASTAANVARVAGVGGLMSGANSAIDSIGTGEDGGTVARNAAEAAGIGAVSAPILGAAGEYVGAKLAGGASKAMRYLASKLDVSPDDLAQHLADRTAAGAPATIAGAVSARDAGVIRRLSENNPEIAVSAQAARTAAQEAGPSEMAAAIEQNIPSAKPTFLQNVPNEVQSKQTLNNALDRNMTARMDVIGTDPVQLRPSIINNRMVQRAAPTVGTIDAAGNEAPSVADKLDALSNGTAGAQPLTVREVETIRQNLRRVGGGTSDLAPASAEAADALGTQAAAAHPGYSEALSDYGDAAKYIEGFNHGQAGNAASSAENSSLRQALDTQHGQDGHAAGIYIHARDLANKGADSAVDVAKTLSRNTAGNTNFTAANPAGAAAVQNTGQAIAARARAINTSTPDAIKEREEKGFGELATGIAKAPLGLTHSAIHSTWRGLQQIFGNTTFSTRVQRQLATQLHSTDPVVQGQAITALRKAGVDNQNLKSLSQRIGGVTGAKLNDLIFGN